MPRLATSTDLEDVLTLAGTKSCAVSALDFSEYDLFVTEGITGFLVLKKQLIRGVTGDRESVIHDSCALTQGLLEYAAQAARGYGSQFLTIEVAPGDPSLELLQAVGFHLESHRISVATADCRAPEGSPYSVRPAAPGDDFLIAVLTSTMLPHTLSAGREYDLSELTFRSMEATFAQVNRQDPASVALVLTQGQALVGHLLLELSEASGYIYDLALAREHWGGVAVRHLMRAGSQLLFQRNVPLLVGDVSAANQRALKVAQRALGFSVDCQRYGLRL